MSSHFQGFLYYSCLGRSILETLSARDFSANLFTSPVLLILLSDMAKYFLIIYFVWHSFFSYKNISSPNQYTLLSNKQEPVHLPGSQPKTHCPHASSHLNAILIFRQKSLTPSLNGRRYTVLCEKICWSVISFAISSAFSL